MLPESVFCVVVDVLSLERILADDIRDESGNSGVLDVVTADVGAADALIGVDAHTLASSFTHRSRVVDAGRYLWIAAPISRGELEFENLDARNA